MKPAAEAGYCSCPVQKHRCWWGAHCSWPLQERGERGSRRYGKLYLCWRLLDAFHPKTLFSAVYIYAKWFQLWL